MTEKQKSAIRCAHADLIGALEAQTNETLDNWATIHDWDAHKKSIKELEESFGFLEPMKSCCVQ